MSWFRKNNVHERPHTKVDPHNIGYKWKGTTDNRVRKGDVVQFILHNNMKLVGIYESYCDECDSYTLVNYADLSMKVDDKTLKYGVFRAHIKDARVLVRGTNR